MKKMTADELVTLYDTLYTERNPFLNQWDELAFYLQPNKVGYASKHGEGEKRTYKLYDSTGIMAADDLAHYLANALTPAHLPWFEVKFDNPKTNKLDAVREWCDEVTRRMSDALLASNFYSQASEFYADIAVFGTASMDCEPLERTNYAGVKVYQGLAFSNVWLKGLVAMEDQYGRVNLTIRCYEKTAKAWLEQFGDKAPKTVKELIAVGKYADKLTMLHAVYPRDPEDIDPDAEKGQDVMGSKMPYASVWIDHKGKEIVSEGGYMELPRCFVRWASITETAYGFGPGMRAIPDVRTVNEAKRLELEAYEKTLDPPFKVRQNNIVGSLDLAAAGQTVVRDMDGLAPLLNGTDFNLSMVKGEELRTSITKAFYGDLINTPAEVDKTMTAYEVARRLERAQRIIGEAIGRLREEFLAWVVERTFGIMYRNGALPQLPPDLIELGATKLSIGFTSPLHASQQAQGLEAVSMFLGDLMALAQSMNPENPGSSPVWDHLDLDTLIRDMAERRRVPAAALRDEKEVEKIRTAKAAAAQQQQQQQALLDGSQAVRNLGAGIGQEAAAAAVTGSAATAGPAPQEQ